MQIKFYDKVEDSLLKFAVIIAKMDGKYDILNEITEIRTCCGFREKVIQESTKPHRQSRFKLAWLMHS